MKHSDIAHGFHIFRDGNAWCAVGPHFQDLQTSEAGFGDTPEEAHAAFRDECMRSSWWQKQPGPFPAIDRFTIHSSTFRD